MPIEKNEASKREPLRAALLKHIKKYFSLHTFQSEFSSDFIL